MAAVLPDRHTASWNSSPVPTVRPRPCSSSRVSGPVAARAAFCGVQAYTRSQCGLFGQPIERLVALLESGDDAAALSRTVAVATGFALRELGRERDAS